MEQFLNQITHPSPSSFYVIQGKDVEVLASSLYLKIKKEIQDEMEANKEKPSILRKEAAKMLNVTLPTLHRWAKAGYLVPVKIGNKILYRMSDIDAFLNRK